MPSLHSAIQRIGAGLALSLAMGAIAPAQTMLTLDTFNAGGAIGSVIGSPIPTSWVGNVTQNAGSITVGGTARDDNGWGATIAPLNASAMSYVQIGGQRDAGNAAQTVSVQLFDLNLNQMTFTVNTSAFAVGASSQVQIPIASWDAGFDPTKITSWNIGGGTPGLVAFRLTLDHLALSTSLISPASGGTITTAGNQVYSGAITLGAAAVLASTGSNGNAITFNSTVDGAQALTLNTPGVTTLAGAVGNAVPLESLATDAGGTTAVNGGKVITTGAQTYHDIVSLGADTLFKSADGILTFLGELLGNNRNLLIEVNQSSSFNRASNLASLTKLGSGTLTLTDHSTYTGATIVSAGTLAFGVSNSLASTSPLTLAGGTLATGGFSQTLGPLTLTASSTLDFGSGASALVFADSSALAGAWTGTLSILNYTTGIDSLRFGSGNTSLTTIQLAQIDFGSGLLAQINESGFVTGVSPIPEPSTYAMCAGLGALALACWRRRIRRTDHQRSRTDSVETRSVGGGR